MIERNWSSVPEQYRPDPTKPWRVAWGLGAFQDFATEAEADDFFARVNGQYEGLQAPFDTRLPL